MWKLSGQNVFRLQCISKRCDFFSYVYLIVQVQKKKMRQNESGIKDTAFSYYVTHGRKNFTR